MELPTGTTSLTLGKVTKYTEGKNGLPYKDKNGRTFARASVRFVELGEDYFGGFWNDKLEEGAKIDVEVYEEVYEGKTYKKFRVAKKEDKLDQELAGIKNELTRMTIILRQIELNTTPKKMHYPTPEEEGITPGDDPF